MTIPRSMHPLHINMQGVIPLPGVPAQESCIGSCSATLAGWQLQSHADMTLCIVACLVLPCMLGTPPKNSGVGTGGGREVGRAVGRWVGLPWSVSASSTVGIVRHRMYV